MNIGSCTSPYHKKGEPFRPEMLEATVDETVGVDVHMLQPGGFCCVPCWKSNVYPDHFQWWMKTYGQKPGPYGLYMLEGGDMVAVFVKRCRQRGLTPFVSLRLNDAHGKEWVDAKAISEVEGKLSPTDIQFLRSWWDLVVSRFYKEHPEYRIGPDLKNWNQRVLNWAIPEVRQRRFGFIEEICQQYDIDGFELDFMRRPSYFRPGETTSQQRAKIMTEFVACVRKVLDRTAKPGQHRWLCARVPSKLAEHDRLGIDLRSMVDAGLDMVNLSTYYYTRQDHDLARIRPLLPDVAIYLEMCHCTMEDPPFGPGYDNYQIRRTTDHQFYTTAHVAYRRGADGVSLFNFVYFREHGPPGRGPFNEPPFHVLKHLGQPEWLGRQPQWYFLANSTPLPRRFDQGQTLTFTLDMAPTEHQRADGLFRLMTAGDSMGCRWTVKVNGTELEKTQFVRKPLDHPYEAGLGRPNQYACFKCPRALAKAGPNRIQITLVEGASVTVRYVDLVLP